MRPPSKRDISAEKSERQTKKSEKISKRTKDLKNKNRKLKKENDKLQKLTNNLTFEIGILKDHIEKTKIQNFEVILGILFLVNYEAREGQRRVESSHGRFEDRPGREVRVWLKVDSLKYPG